ncbi:MAG: hypothetical protein HW374_2065, partial [Bacteroidetes bacterium]|nr:hypothetical protein [Bacteroidota bacterium]
MQGGGNSEPLVKTQMNLNNFRPVTRSHRWPPRANAAGHIYVCAFFQLVTPADLEQLFRNKTERPELSVVRVAGELKVDAVLHGLLKMGRLVVHEYQGI